jgi:hypothetical protein
MRGLTTRPTRKRKSNQKSRVTKKPTAKRATKPAAKRATKRGPRCRAPARSRRPGRRRWLLALRRGSAHAMWVVRQAAVGVIALLLDLLYLIWRRRLGL